MKMAGGGRGEGFAGPAQRGCVHAAGARVRDRRRGAGRGVQGAQHAGADAPDAHRARGRAAALGDQRRVRSHPARRVHPAGPRRPPTGRSRTTWARPGATTPARPASWPPTWPTPPSGRRSARAKRSGTHRSREAAGRRRRRAGARPLLGAPSRAARRRPLLRARQSRHRRDRHQPSHPRRRHRPHRGCGGHARGRPDRSSAPKCRWRAGSPTGCRAEGRRGIRAQRGSGADRGIQGVRQGRHGRGGDPDGREPNVPGASARRWTTWIDTRSRWW